MATLLLSSLFAGIIVGPVFLYAEYNPPTPRNDYGESTPYEGDGAATNFYGPEFVGPPAPGTVEAAGLTAAQQQEVAAKTAASQPTAAQELAKAFECGFTNPKGCLAALMDIAMWIAARTLWIAGVLFNMTLHYTLNLNTLLAKLPIVDIGWKVLRDLSNIVFIFIALWCGISVTLGIGDNGKHAWGYLAQMVLVALFINFSLFVSKAVVDASNVAALHFYSLIVEPPPPGKDPSFDGGLSEAFLYGLKLSTIYNSKQIGSGAGFDPSEKNSLIGSIGNTAQAKLSFANIILIGFFGSLFIIVTAWVFFAAALMFIYRAVTLIMLMMLSPLAFVGLILPGASGMAHAWWSKLWSQAFFAPLYLALAYIVVRTINSPAFQGGLGMSATQSGTGFAAALTGTGPNSVAVIFNFVMLIGLMVGSLIVAEHLGAKGSDMAMAGFEKIKGGAIGITGAAVRGAIKAPSAAVQGIGSAIGNTPGKALGGFSKSMQWIATRDILKDTKVGNWMNKKGAAVGKAGEDAHKKMAGVRRIARYGELLDPRYMEERLSQSKIGNNFISRAIRGATTGALANASIGGKSLQEAYDESEHDASVRHVIGFINDARKAGSPLETLQHDEEHLEKAQADEEAGVARAKAGVDRAKEGITPEQQKAAQEAEKELAEAKKVPPAQQQEITKAEKELEQAMRDLAAAQKKLAKDPTNLTLKAVVDSSQKEVTRSEKNLEKQKALPPEQQKRVDDAKAKLAKATTRILTPEQQKAITDAQAELATAQAEKALHDSTLKGMQAEVTLEEGRLKDDMDALAKLTAADGAAFINAKDKVATSKEAVQKKKDELTRQEENFKKLDEPKITEKEKKVADAKKPMLTAEETAALTAATDGLKTAEGRLAQAEKALEDFKDKNGSEISRLENIISKAWAQMTPQEAAHLTPKNDFLEQQAMFDYEYMPTSHATAIRDDEHALTEKEKEEFFHNRTHRLKAKGMLVDQKNALYRQEWLKTQKEMNRQAKELEEVTKELRKGLEGVTDALAEKLRELGEELKA